MLFICDVGYKVFFWLKRMRKRFPKMLKLAQLYEYYFTLLLNRKLVPWLQKHPVKWGLNTEKRDESYTVSLTSFPARIEYVHIAIETIMRQTFKPDRIILWLAESQFPEKKLPDSLTRLESRGLTIRWCDDLRSHKKYHYVFREYPESNIILMDDDIFYPRDTIKKLVKLHKKYPRDIVCVSAQVVAPALSALPSVWPTAELGKRYISCPHIQAFSGAGSLFPAKWYPAELFNKEKAMTLAGSADDLWLKAISLLAGVKTTMVYPLRGFPVDIQIQNNETLFSVNGGHGENINDAVWQALITEYGLAQVEKQEEEQ